MRLTRLLLVVTLGVAGCAGGTTSTASVVEPASSPSATASAAPAASASDLPPAASLAVDGGEPVVGQLGSYTWHDTGSDAPWLPGAPIAVGVGEVLAMAFTPPVPPTSWRARYTPVRQTDASGARPLGAGTGSTTSFPAPPAGRWTVVVEVTFDAGAAAYFWNVSVD